MQCSDCDISVGTFGWEHSDLIFVVNFKRSVLPSGSFWQTCSSAVLKVPIGAFPLPRLRRAQHHLQRVTGPVSQLQQPVRGRVGIRAGPRLQPLPGLLLPGPHLLEEVRPPARLRRDRTPISASFLGTLFPASCQPELPTSCFCDLWLNPTSYGFCLSARFITPLFLTQDVSS